MLPQASPDASSGRQPVTPICDTLVGRLSLLFCVA
jgi:hypothetical protein